MIYILACLNFSNSIPPESSCNIVPFGHEIALLSSLSFVNTLLMRVAYISQFKIFREKFAVYNIKVAFDCL